MNTKNPRPIASLAAAGRSGKPHAAHLHGIGRTVAQESHAAHLMHARRIISARYGLTWAHDDLMGTADAHARYAADLYALPPELWVSVATEPPRTIARLDKYARRMRRHATQSGKRRPTPEESREAIARLYGFETYQAAAATLSGKQEGEE